MAKITIQTGGTGLIDWGNGHRQTFDYPAASAKNALGIARENLNAQASWDFDLDDDEAARFFVWGDTLQYS